MQKIRWKKNLPGILLWLCLSIIVCATCALTVSGIMMQNDIPDVRLWAAAALGLLCAEGIAFFLLTRCRKTPDRLRRKRKAVHHGYVPELLAFAVLFGMQAAAVWYFGIRLEQPDPFFELAAITENGALPLMAHNASYVYTLLLSWIFRFLGNNSEAAVVFQLLLQTGTILLLFGAVRRMLGRGASIGFLLLAAPLPGFLLHNHSLSPEFLLGLLLVIILDTLISLLEWLGEEASAGWKLIFGGLLLGVLNGIFIWLDLFGVVLWLALCISVLQLCGVSVKKRILTAASLSAAAVLTLFLAFFAESIVTGGKLAEIELRYLEYYRTGVSPIVLQMPEITELAALLVLGVLTGLAVPGFLKQPEERTAPVTVLLAGVTVFWYMGLLPSELSLIPALCWLLAACTGLQSIADIRSMCAALQADNSAQPDENVQPDNSVQPDNGKMPDGGMPKPSGQTDGRIRYIPNPLPLPKKHIKREIQFDLEPSGEQMEFDHDLPEDGNDFDLS